MTHEATTAEQDTSLQLATLCTVLDAMDTLALAELERALRLKLFPEADLARTRAETLGPLAELLAAEGTMSGTTEDWPGVPIVPRHRYDEHSGGASSNKLVQEYGSWLRACRAAYGLAPDGSHTGPGKPWTTRRAVRHGYHRWDDDTCLAWVRRCALALGQPPTVEDFGRWRRAYLNVPGNESARVPTLRSIVTHSGKGSWPKVIARLGVTASELADARASRLPATAPAPTSLPDRIRMLDDDTLNDLQLTRSQAKKLAGRKPRLALPLTAAIELARTLNVSLDHLADLTSQQGTPPTAGGTIDKAAVTALRALHRVSDRAVREAGGMSLSEWRGILSGKREPTLGQLAGIATVLGAESDALLASLPGD